jgi:SSS family transporter
MALMEASGIKGLGGVDYGAIGVFFIMMVATGLYFFLKTKKSGDYFIGGRIVPGWISGLSFFMTTFSAATFVAGASVAYRHAGWILMLVLISDSIGSFCCAPFAARWRRLRITTVPEYLEKRFGPSSRNFFALVALPARILDNGNRVYVTAVFLGTALGIGKGLGLWGSSFIILVYTFMGGIWAVVATDVIQFFLMTIAVIVVSILGLHFVGGFSNFVSQSPENFWAISPNDQFSLSYVIGLAIIGFIAKNGFWSLIQRYSATPSDWEAKKVPIISGFGHLLIVPFILFPAMLARITIPEAIDSLVQGGMPLAIATERSFVLVSMKFLPIGLMGFVVVAVFSATMSALSSEYNIISAVCTRDIYQKMIKKGAPVDDKKILWGGRMATVVIAVLCTLVGSQIHKFGGSWTYLFTMLGLTSAPTFLPPFVGTLYRKTPAWGANLAFFTGLASGIVTKFGFQAPFIIMVLVNVSITVGTCLIAGILDPVKGERKRMVDEMFEQLSRPYIETRTEAGPATDREKAPNINGIIGAGCALFGLYLIVSAFISRTGPGFMPNFISAVGLCGIGAVLLYKPSNR